MTVNTTDITDGPYIGNGVADAFSYNFRIEDKTQVKVFETDSATNIQTTLTVDTDYTVAGIGADGGGTITRVAGALPSLDEWFIRSDYKETQLTDLESQGGFFPDVHEAVMDKLTFLVQQLRDTANRSFRIPDSFSDTFNVEISPKNGTVLGWVGSVLSNVTLTFQSDGDVSRFADVGSMVASSLAPGESAQTVSYYGGWAATVKGPRGGARYEIVTKAEHDIVRGTGTVDELGDHTLANGSVALLVFYRGQVDVTQYGATGLGVADEIASMQAAADSGAATVRASEGLYRITAPWVVPINVHVLGDSLSGQGRVYRSGSGWENSGGTEIHVDFGAGTTTLSSSAVILGLNRSGISNVSFWYPGQDPDAATPTAFPPSIHVPANSETPTIRDVNFINSYIGVDVTLLHTNLKLSGLTGFPLFRGVKIGQTNGFETLENVNFSSGFAYRTTPPQQLWMVNNAIVLELLYSTWATYVNWKCFGYQKIVFSDTGPYAPGDPGASQRSTFIGCMADNTPYGFHFKGSTAGIFLIGCIVNPTNDLDPTILDGWGFKYDATLPTATGNSDISFTDCRVLNAPAVGFIIINAKGYSLTDCYVMSFATDFADDAIKVINSSNGSVRGGYIDGDASLANSNGITFDATCSKFSVTEVNFLDFNSTGHKQLHLKTGAVEYTIKNNHFNDATAGLVGIVDDAGDSSSIIKDNQDDKQATTLGNGDVSGGVLQLPPDIDIVTYSGTTALTNIADYRDGREFSIIFVNVVSLTSGSGMVLKGGSRSTAAFEIITFKSTINTGWEL